MAIYLRREYFEMNEKKMNYTVLDCLGILSILLSRAFQIPIKVFKILDA